LNSLLATLFDDGYGRVLRLRLLALVPVLLASMLNTGYQYLDAEAVPGGGGWRQRLAEALAVERVDPGVYDWLITGSLYLLPLLLLMLGVGLFWERLFAERRGRPLEPGVLPVAVLFTLLLPPATPLSHAVFGMSFAMLLGLGIFGGDGRSFLSPALLGFAILQVSFPGVATGHPLWHGLVGYGGSEALSIYARGGAPALAEVGIDPWSAFIGAIPGSLGTTSVLAVALGAALLLARGVISWRLLAAQVVGVLLAATIFNGFGSGTGAAAMPAYWHLLLGGFAFGAVFLACDPVASCCTNPGRWIQGLLIGTLLVLIRVINPTHPDAVIPVLLLASILAPLIDHAVIAWNVRGRARRHV
jgi:Na+-transporting NADH:ubiquinone oxidoreductase subunit B